MSTLSTTTSANHRFHPAEYMRYGYLANGWGKPLRWSGITAAVQQVGIEGPSTTLNSWQPTSIAGSPGSGVTSAGAHFFRYRYMDSTTGFVSNPSAEWSLTGVGSYTLTFQIAASGNDKIVRSTDTKVDRIVLEMTTAGGTAFYKAGEVSQSESSIVINITDPELEVSFLPWPDWGHDPPPITKYLVAHRRRFFAFGQVRHDIGKASFSAGFVTVDAGTPDPDWNNEVLGSSATLRSDVKWFIRKEADTKEYEISYYNSGTNKIYLKDYYTGLTSTENTYQIYSKANVIWVSNPGYPEGFTPLKFLDSPQGEMSGNITAGVGYGSSMLFFTENTMFKLAWDRGPLADPFMVNQSTKNGALSQRVVVEVEGRIYAMDRNGWHVWSGSYPKVISRPIDDLLDSIDFTYSENFHASYFPNLRAIRWFVCYTGDTYPKNYIQYDIDTGQWGTGEYKQAITESRLVLEKYGRVKTILGDENGYVWLGDFGTADGASPTYTHLTADTATSTVITITTNLPEDYSGIAGSYVYWVEGDQYRLITSNDFASFTVSPAFDSTPAAGTTYWIGPIPSLLKTKAFGAALSSRVKKSKYLTLQYVPTTRAGELNVRVFEDYSATKKQWRAGGNDLDGITWPATAGTDWKVNTAFAGGVVDVPIGSEYRRVFEVELELIEPDVPLELLLIEHDGGETRDHT